jgi:hypothetical protein
MCLLPLGINIAMPTRMNTGMSILQRNLLHHSYSIFVHQQPKIERSISQSYARLPCQSTTCPVMASQGKRPGEYHIALYMLRLDLYMLLVVMRN